MLQTLCLVLMTLLAAIVAAQGRKPSVRLAAMSLNCFDKAWPIEKGIYTGWGCDWPNDKVLRQAYNDAYDVAYIKCWKRHYRGVKGAFEADWTLAKAEEAMATFPDWANWVYENGICLNERKHFNMQAFISADALCDKRAQRATTIINGETKAFNKAYFSCLKETPQEHLDKYT